MVVEEERNSTQLLSSTKSTEESDSVSHTTTKVSTEDLSNSPEKTGEHEKNEKKRDRRSLASKGTESTTQENSRRGSKKSCLQWLDCGDRLFYDVTTCEDTSATKSKASELSRIFGSQKAFFPTVEMECTVHPKFVGSTGKHDLPVQGLIGNCNYEYDLQCNDGYTKDGKKHNVRISATCFCKHRWDRRNRMSQRNPSANSTTTCSAEIHCLCQMNIEESEQSTSSTDNAISNEVKNLIKTHQNKVTKLGCYSHALEDKSFTATCITDNSPHLPKPVTPPAGTNTFNTVAVTENQTNSNSEESTSLNPLIFLPLSGPNSHQRFPRDLSAVQRSREKSTDALTTAGVAGVAGIAEIATFGTLCLGIILLLIILITYKKKRNPLASS